MKLSITHITRYDYDREVSFGPHLLYLRPRESPQLRVDSFSLSLEPAARLHWMRDDFDNFTGSAHFASTASVLAIGSHCGVETSDRSPFDFVLRDYAINFPFDYEPLHRQNLAAYLGLPVAADQAQLRAWVRQRMPETVHDTVGWLVALNRTIFTSLHYARRDKPGIQSASTTMRSGTGTCRDYATLLIACARTHGLAARFVSDYVHDAATAGTAAGEMHAWSEVYLPGAGWLGVDPTHGVVCGDTYVPVAHAAVAESLNPI